MELRILTIIIVLGIFLFFRSIKIVKRDERMVVLRLGRISSIGGPGFVLVIPILDKGMKVDLSNDIPGWETLPEEQLVEKIKELPGMDALIRSE